MRPTFLLVGVVAVVVAQETCSDTAEKKEETTEDKGCGCNAGRGDVKFSKTSQDGKAVKQPAAQREASSQGLKNRTEEICSTGERFYEGYIKGCYHWYHDEYTGMKDCGEVKIEGADFRMGTDFLGDARFGKDNLEKRYRDNSIHGANRADAEYPSRQMHVNTFYIDRCEVTNAQFKDFVDATGYVTDAQLYNWSFVLEPFVSPRLMESDPSTVQAAPWWRAIEGAHWAQPEGPGSSIDEIQEWYGKPTPGVPNKPSGDRWNHPVSHASWRDAYNFCRWRGKRLPHEREHEYALRGGLEQKIFAWGDELYPEGKHRMNIWQGDLIEYINTAEDGWRGTSPTASYPPNGHGVYDLTGNIWEWVNDDFTKGKKQDVADRPETKAQDGTSPRVSHKAKRGGSHMCHASYVNEIHTSPITGLVTATGHLRGVVSRATAQQPTSVLGVLGTRKAPANVYFLNFMKYFWVV